MANAPIILILSLLASVLAGEAAYAQVQQQMVFGGQTNIQISQDQQLMLGAANKMMQRDFKGAETLYNQAIALNGSNINAYLQRAVTRRELGDTGGMSSDAQTVISLSDNALQQNPNNPTVYYERGMAYRLLKQFDQAQSDISTGMRMGGRSSWQTDLQAIDMERKTAQ